MNCYYFGSYSNYSNEDYTSSIPGNIKMHYLEKKMQESGIANICIISFALKNKKAYKHKKTKTDLGSDLYYSPGFSQTSRIGRLLDKLFKKIYFFFFFLLKIKKKDKILIYHSGWTSFLKRMCRFKKVFSILEVEEVYSFSDYADEKPEKEIKVIKGFDSYIFINDYLPVLLKTQVPFVVCYGVIRNDLFYRYDKCEKKQDDKIHLVYAGVISNKRQGAFCALDVASKLSNNYVLHIIGSGSEEDIRCLKSKIYENNRISDRCKVELNGFLKGDALYNFLSSCDIGLSTYNLRANFSDCSLPSKVITYMCCGLKVVIGYTKAFQYMPISKCWFFYTTQDAENIAISVKNAASAPRVDHFSELDNYDKRIVEFFKKFV